MAESLRSHHPRGLSRRRRTASRPRMSPFAPAASRPSALSTAPPPKCSMPAVCTCCPASSTPRCISASPASSTRRISPAGTAAAALGRRHGGVRDAQHQAQHARPPKTSPTSCSRAKGRAWCRSSPSSSAPPPRTSEQLALTRAPAGLRGVKMFMGSSTGTLLVADDENVRRVLANGRRRIAVHAEDEARLRERHALVKDGADVGHASGLARRRDGRAGDRAAAPRWRARPAGASTCCMSTTAEEMPILAANKDIATVEITPQHLTLAAPECYERLGTLAQMNPPIRDARHREALWRAVRAGHRRLHRLRPCAAHARGEGEALSAVALGHAGRADAAAADARSRERRPAHAASAWSISPAPVRRASTTSPARAASPSATTPTSRSSICKAQRDHHATTWIASRCGWTPFDGMTVTGWPSATIIRGRIVMRDDQLIGDTERRFRALPRHALTCRKWSSLSC